ncbi:hypothetical protein HMPREF2724_11590 [Corynebacterium sp. HMSC071F07]|nr:hypothetical protein HMPREF2724_11590 [Corynebacterium sp. HMSC071F07]
MAISLPAHRASVCWDTMTTLVWFRDDLRLCDNPALTWAASRGEVIACVLDEPAYPRSRPLGSATSWWRERSLSCRAEELASYNVPLYRLNGDARTTIPAFAESQNVSAVCWNRRYHLSTIDAVLKESLHSQGLEIHSFAAHCLVEPQAVKPYKVYSAFAPSTLGRSFRTRSLAICKFDPDGTYVRQWAPPLSPPPIVDLKQSRQAALDAYQEIC